MFLHHGITGSRLPARTVCLTYDDGPGPHTNKLARYLCDERISACFFVMGIHALEYPATMAQLRGCGHIVGNHTHNHPGLVDFALSGGDVVSEVAAAHDAIKPLSLQQARLFASALWKLAATKQTRRASGLFHFAHRRPA